MLRRIGLISTVVFLSAGTAAAGQTVDRDTVQALRQMAIAAGQTSSSAVKSPPKDQKAVVAEQRVLDNHRAAFFARAYSGETRAALKTAEGTQAATPPAPSAVMGISAVVDSATVEALRQMAIATGQSSGSQTEPPSPDQTTIESARASISRHRSDFFARVYGIKAGS